MKVIAYDNYPNDSGKKLLNIDLDTLLSTSDVISLHCPLFPETEGIINKDSIAKMKDGVIIPEQQPRPVDCGTRPCRCS